MKCMHKISKIVCPVLIFPKSNCQCHRPELPCVCSPWIEGAWQPQGPWQQLPVQEISLYPRLPELAFSRLLTLLLATMGLYFQLFTLFKARSRYAWHISNDLTGIMRVNFKKLNYFS